MTRFGIVNIPSARRWKVEQNKAENEQGGGGNQLTPVSQFHFQQMISQ
jgi:hypothetical protein